jgi:hypothetical protein
MKLADVLTNRRASMPVFSSADKAYDNQCDSCMDPEDDILPD